MSFGLLQVFVRVGSQVQQTPEEGQMTYRPKRQYNKDEDNSLKTLNDKKKKKLCLKNSDNSYFVVYNKILFNIYIY